MNLERQQSARPVERSAWTEEAGTILSQRSLGGSAFLLELSAPQIAAAARPGQFVELIYAGGFGPIVRRPFGIHQADRPAGVCLFIYVARGAFTTGLSDLGAGDQVSLLGPLGQPFTWDARPDARHLLVAGGSGATPLAFLAREMLTDPRRAGAAPDTVTAIHGARTRELLIGMEALEAMDLLLHAITDDGSHGAQGRVTDLLERLLGQHAADRICVYACGPRPMLRAVAGLSAAHKVRCQVSVETSMPCGIGACEACAVPMAAQAGWKRYARACWDGPVFDGAIIDWEAWTA